MNLAECRVMPTRTLYVVNLGVLMVVLDTTIVAVALPYVQSDLGFSDANQSWLVNAYTLTFGGFLLLGGRLADLYGRRRLFLVGINLFTAASVACGVAVTARELLVARGLQGVGGALVSAVSLALVMNLFTDCLNRAKAVAIYGFVCAAGGGIGEILGGLLTKVLGWHWIFLVNVPIGIVVSLLGYKLIPRDLSSAFTRVVDWGGAAVLMSAAVLTNYVIVNAADPTIGGERKLILLGCAAILFVALGVIETRVSFPLVPTSLIRSRMFAAVNAVGALWAAGTFGWFVVCALYLQRILGFDALQVGLSFVPATVVMSALSLGLSGAVIKRFGSCPPLYVGLTLVAGSYLLFSRAPVSGVFAIDVLPGMLLQGVGTGLASTPLLIAATTGVSGADSGFVSGMINTSFVMGGAIGLALCTTLAAAVTGDLLRTGASHVIALNSGYQSSFALSAILTLTATVAGIGALGLRKDADTLNASKAAGH